MLDYLDELSFRKDADYRFLKFANCVYYVNRNTLHVVFYYDDTIAKKLDNMKNALEEAFKAYVDLDITYQFEYKKSYIDEILLTLAVKKFLVKNFSMLTLSLTDEDIKTERTQDGFAINLYLPKQSHNYIKANNNFKDFVDKLHDENFCSFEFLFNVKDIDAVDSQSALEKLEQYMENKLPNGNLIKVDKTLRVKNIEYWLGKPIKQRPIKIEHLKISQEDQITGGTMEFLTKREYQKHDKEKGETEARTFWTFLLNDGSRKLNCVFFPSAKTHDKFEKLVNGTAICVIGVHSERNGRVGFRVQGISFCEMQ